MVFDMQLSAFIKYVAYEFNKRNTPYKFVGLSTVLTQLLIIRVARGAEA